MEGAGGGSYLWRGQGEALHPFGHFDAEETHAVLDDLGHVLGNDEAHGLLLLVGLIEDRVVVKQPQTHSSSESVQSLSQKEEPLNL